MARTSTFALTIMSRLLWPYLTRNTATRPCHFIAADRTVVCCLRPLHNPLLPRSLDVAAQVGDGGSPREAGAQLQVGTDTADSEGRAGRSQSEGGCTARQMCCPERQEGQAGAGGWQESGAVVHGRWKVTKQRSTRCAFVISNAQAIRDT